MYSPCTLALDLAVALRGQFDLSHVLSEGKLSPQGSLCSETLLMNLPLWLKAKRVDGRWEAPCFTPHSMEFTLLLSCLDSHWLWHVIQKYSAAWGLSWEAFALLWLWAFLALVNSVPSGCCSDQLYPTVETAQASLSNLIIFPDWKALGFCEMEVFRPQSTKGQLLGTCFC